MPPPARSDYAKETALHKAIEVAQRRFAHGELADLVIAADTVVDLGGEVLEKPEGEQGATSMLSRLSGSQHQVHTGVALILPRATDPSLGVSPRVCSFAETTTVDFAPLSPELIAAYVATGEPLGKAGAYGIQGVAGSFVKRIQGCYFNVVGLPLHRTTAEIARLIDDGAL